MLMMFNLNYLFFFMFLVSFISFCLNRYHLLMVLLSLEFIVLIIYISLIIYLNFFMMELFFSMMFLVFSVCEGVLGLSILVMMVRMHGNDYFQVLSVL
uniref:NADH-ubiquinone oxidoreductase chain 4L n=1 Tax=Megabeleses liriodendrovorax TaxID=2735432 RepID=A0A8F1B8J7_9HYME|nr:NADH dehydrogenase subunit 4L [Megabeleses liriodendrovorax]QWM93820.1 NADH dehydrogenase subunit 4L [Megabeleses liriodendrovorax]